MTTLHSLRVVMVVWNYLAQKIFHNETMPRAHPKPNPAGGRVSQRFRQRFLSVPSERGKGFGLREGRGGGCKTLTVVWRNTAVCRKISWRGSAPFHSCTRNTRNARRDGRCLGDKNARICGEDRLPEEVSSFETAFPFIQLCRSVYCEEFAERPTPILFLGSRPTGKQESGNIEARFLIHVPNKRHL